jgi:hypothetical protein
MSEKRKGRAAGFSMTPEAKIKQRKSMAITYRQKKNICVRCGKNLHEGACIELYDKSDYRNPKDKILKSNLTPDELTISDNSLTFNDTINTKDVLSFKTKDFGVTVESSVVELKIKRPFILIDITPSPTGERFNADFINFYAKQYKNHIVLLTGNISFYDGFFKTVGVNQEVNVSTALLHANKNDITSHINECDLFISFNFEYSEYCSDNEINCIYFRSSKSQGLESANLHEIPIWPFNEIDLKIFKDNSKELLFDI